MTAIDRCASNNLMRLKKEIETPKENKKYRYMITDQHGNDTAWNVKNCQKL